MLSLFRTTKSAWPRNLLGMAAAALVASCGGGVGDNAPDANAVDANSLDAALNSVLLENQSYSIYNLDDINTTDENGVDLESVGN